MTNTISIRWVQASGVASNLSAGIEQSLFRNLGQTDLAVELSSIIQRDVLGNLAVIAAYPIISGRPGIQGNRIYKLRRDTAEVFLNKAGFGIDIPGSRNAVFPAWNLHEGTFISGLRAGLTSIYDRLFESETISIAEVALAHISVIGTFGRVMMQIDRNRANLEGLDSRIGYLLAMDDLLHLLEQYINIDERGLLGVGRFPPSDLESANLVVRGAVSKARAFKKGRIGFGRTSFYLPVNSIAEEFFHDLKVFLLHGYRGLTSSEISKNQVVIERVLSVISKFMRAFTFDDAGMPKDLQELDSFAHLNSISPSVQDETENPPYNF